MSQTTEKQALMEAFSTAYNALNTAQKEAVDTIDGPVMVIAGPGTGKTQILTLRIANILLKTDTALESILALTFTESGAKAMRTRLHKYIGARAYQVPIHTFHGFADKLIREYPTAYERIVGGRPASDMEKISIIETILDTGDIKILRPFGDPTHNVKSIQGIIGDLKKEYISPDDLNSIIATAEEELQDMDKFHEKGPHKGKVKGAYADAEKSINKNRELLYVFRAYEALLRDKKLYDFEDMIVETVKALTADQDMLRDLQEQYQYVLADEHQDVNESQNKILDVLCSFHDSPNIFVVGDEKQAIFRFQGASLDNFLFFQNRFPGTKIISLTENYRSGQLILDAAHSLLAVEDGPLKDLRIPLHSSVGMTSMIDRRSFSHAAIEDEWLVDSIVRHIENKIAPEEIAVIVRKNAEVESLAYRLRKAGVLVESSADGDILVHVVTKTVEALLTAVLLGRDEEALFAVLHGSYWGLSALDVVKIAKARSYDMPLLALLGDEESLRKAGVVNTEAALRIVTVINEARIKSVTEAPHRVLEYILQASGFLGHVMVSDPFDGVRIIRRLYDEVEAQLVAGTVGTLTDLLTVFKQRRAYNLGLSAPYIHVGAKAVQVMTAHKSKGLEFTHVYIPHVQDNAWGGTTNRTNFKIPLSKHAVTEIDKADDEKRLFYVALTRAKTNLYLSCAEMNSEGKAITPSRLFDDINGELVTHQEVAEYERSFNPAKLLTTVTTKRELDSEFILNSLRDRGFSATSLNNFIKNPWDYVYRNVLRIPEIQPTHMQFGTAMHSVLEYITRTYTDTKAVPNDTAIKKRLEVALGRLPLSDTEFVRLLDKGLTIAYAYSPQLIASLGHSTKEEFKINVVLDTGIPEFPELMLTGNIDRIDFDEEGQMIKLVDYKTGKAKTRNAIEGRTADEDARKNKRQLVFYALLMKLHGDERYQAKRGLLSFIEPDSKGVIHQEEFFITDEEIAALKIEIIEVLKTIISGEFLQDVEVIKQSEYADLARQLVG